jgi:hypothetical protein
MDRVVSRWVVAACVGVVIALAGGCVEVPIVPTAQELALFKDASAFEGQTVVVRGRFQLDHHFPDLFAPVGPGCLNLVFVSDDVYRHAVENDGENLTLVGTIYRLSEPGLSYLGQCQEFGLRVQQLRW